MNSPFSMDEAKQVLFSTGSSHDLRFLYGDARAKGWNPFDPRLYEGPERLNLAQLTALIENDWNPNQSLVSGQPLWVFELEHRTLGECFKMPWHFKKAGADFKTRHLGCHWFLPHARGLLALEVEDSKIKEVWREEWLWMEHQGSAPSLVSSQDWLALFRFAKSYPQFQKVWPSLLGFAMKDTKTLLSRV